MHRKCAGMGPRLREHSSCDTTMKRKLWHHNENAMIFFFFARRAELIKGKLQGPECILYLVTILSYPDRGQP